MRVITQLIENLKHRLTRAELKGLVAAGFLDRHDLEEALLRAEAACPVCGAATCPGRQAADLCNHPNPQLQQDQDLDESQEMLSETPASRGRTKERADQSRRRWWQQHKLPELTRAGRRRQ